jgi:hypothetical protein
VVCKSLARPFEKHDSLHVAGRVHVVVSLRAGLI